MLRGSEGGAGRGYLSPAMPPFLATPYNNPRYEYIKMSGFSFKGLTILFLLAPLVMRSTFDICDAGRGCDWRAGVEVKSGGGSNPSNPNQSTEPKPQPSPSPSPPAPLGTIFDVLDFGAKGDGIADDTKVVAKSIIISTSTLHCFQIIDRRYVNMMKH